MGRLGRKMKKRKEKKMSGLQRRLEERKVAADMGELIGRKKKERQ